jgi:hypothetical protein
MVKFPLYYSNNLSLTLNNGQGYCTDKANVLSSLPALCVGFLLISLGILEWLDLLKINNAPAINDITQSIIHSYTPVFSVYFFDFCFILLGILIVTTNLLNFFQYNKYLFKKGNITIIHRRLFSGKKVIIEDKKNYKAVRFRIEFTQSGLVTKNRYIIELYHKDINKIIPLYISTNNANIHRKWKEFVKLFKLPAIICTDKGMKIIENKDLGKSIISLHKSNVIKDDFDTYEKLPKTLVFVRKKDKIVIKVKKIIWDAYSMFLCAGGIIASIILIATVCVYFSNTSEIYGLKWLSVLLFFVILLILQLLFKKDKLVIKRKKIIHVHKYMLFSTKHSQIMKKDIEAVEVIENPVTENWILSIISDDSNIAFGPKIKPADLHWLKRFLIHEIIKQ